MRRRHATSPGFSDHYQDLGISSYKEVNLCRGSEISVVKNLVPRAEQAVYLIAPTRSSIQHILNDFHRDRNKDHKGIYKEVRLSDPSIWCLS